MWPFPRTQPKSIRRSIQAFLLINVLLTGGFLLALLHLDLRQGSAQADFVYRSARVGEILQYIDDMEHSLLEYMRTWQDPSLEHYLDKSRGLETLLVLVADICADAQPSLDYIRRLDAFNSYQQELLAQPESVPVGRLATLSYLRLALAGHKAQAHELVHNDLILSRALYERILTRLRVQRVVVWGIFIAFFLLALAAFARSLVAINKSMREMHATLQRLSQKDWTAPDLPEDRHVELAGIAATVNEMKHVIAGHIARLEEHARLERQLDQEKLENERKERLLVEARMANLKAQINPHFLFNTLNIIGKSALLEEPELVMELIEATARILRYSLQTADRQVAIRDEVDIAETYLYVQKNRFGPALTYDISVAPGLGDCRIQSMLLQPLLENCFKHGFAEVRALHITVDICDLGEKIAIAVADNGGGFDTSGPEGAFLPGDGIGVRNIRRRLQLEYGPDAAMRIESAPGRGTRVLIDLPKERSIPA